MPAGRVRSTSDLGLAASDGIPRLLQARALDAWPDGSVRWALLDMTADVVSGVVTPAVLTTTPSGATANRLQDSDAGALRVVTHDDGAEISTGRMTVALTRAQPFPFSAVSVDGVPAIDEEGSGFRVGIGGRVFDLVIAELVVQERGPLRAEIHMRAAPRTGAWPNALEVVGRLELFAHSAVVRLEITLRNSRSARHPGGQWVLGDPGSILLDSAALVITTPREIDDVQAAVEPGASLAAFDRPFEIHQESSGGEQWNSPAQRNRHGVIPVRFRGYRLQAGAAQQHGLRAEPIVVVRSAAQQIAVAIPQFWENFPRAIRVDARAIEMEVFPRDSGDLHELQGGERKTHRIALAFDRDDVSDPPLAWCHEPAAIYPSPDWCCSSGAVPFIVPAKDDPETEYLRLVEIAHDPDQGFLAKRERFDEYGWRHFGDLPADHESLFQPKDQPFVSHYNNQYDAIAAFAVHFLRTGDVRWWRLMDDLARHVRDIDIYHTTEDKAAYNGGLFWHTYHYVDAGTSTHRTYPRGIAAGGGPSAEHNYTVGLMLHYFLTGEVASRDAAVGLARWVLAMDDGRTTPFRWLASGPTGYASATGSPDYHGPGRGAANSIIACLSAYRLTGDPIFGRKAEELIRRSIHPRDDLEARCLLDTERRWYYTVFLQALGVYLQEKLERGDIDEMFAYAHASLLHYARWMATQERPYLERPEVLEYPTETWAAQDLRKAEVFWWAAMHASRAERDTFLARARFFFDYAVTTLAEAPTRHFTRPLVLALVNGVRSLRGLNAFFVGADDRPVVYVPSEPGSFKPQRQRAMRRARLAALLIIGAAGALALLAAL